MEPRLSRKLIGFAGAGPPKLYAPPAAEDFPVRRGGSVAAFPFPRWFVAQEPEAGCADRAGRAADPPARPLPRPGRAAPLRGKTGRRDPVRARLSSRSRGRSRLVLVRTPGRQRPAGWSSRSWSGARPATSPTSVSAAPAASPARSPTRRRRDRSDPCRGERPWLGKHASEDCGEAARLLVRTASNAWFPQIVSVLSLPDRGSELDRVDEAELWPSGTNWSYVKNAAFLEDGQGVVTT